LDGGEEYKMLDSKTKKIFKDYYFAYLWANGKNKTRSLKLSKSGAWYYVSGQPLQNLPKLTKILLSRPQFQER
jgi:hypothetical protein